MWRHLLVPLAMLASACGGGPEPTRSSGESSGSESPHSDDSVAPPTRPPLPPPVEGTFELPVRVPLATIEELIDAVLPKHEKQGYRQWTRPGRSPAIEARYEIWRDPVKVRFSGSTLRVEVPVRYAARFHARLKNPFGGKWLRVARDEAWGTKRKPLRLRLKLRTQIEISRRWELSLKTAVEPPRHGPPPGGKICTGGGFKLCVAKSSIAPQVQKQMDAELMPRIRKAAADFDRQAVRMVALRSRVERLFKQLLRPRAADHGRWMMLEPKDAALSLKREGDAIVALPALSARLSYHERKPTRVVAKLPDRASRSSLPRRRADLPEAFVPGELRALLQGL